MQLRAQGGTEVLMDGRPENREREFQSRFGTAATERFRGSGKTATIDVPKERVSLLANEVLGAVYETVPKHKVTYDEFNALKPD